MNSSTIIVGKIISITSNLESAYIELDNKKIIPMPLFYPPFFYQPKIGSTVNLLQVEFQPSIYQYHLLSFTELDQFFFSLDGKNLKSIFSE